MKRNKKTEIKDEIKEIKENAEEKIDDLKQERESVFQKAKAAGARNRKKIFYGLGTAGAAVGGFVTGMLFERHKTEEDEDPIGEVVEQINTEDSEPEVEPEQ